MRSASGSDRWYNLIASQQMMVALKMYRRSRSGPTLMLRLFRVFDISCFSYFVFSCPFVPYVNVFFFRILHVSRVVCKFRCVYICVIPSCSFSASSTSVCSYFFVLSTPLPAFGKPLSLSSVLYCISLLVFCRLRLVFVLIRFMFIFRNLPSSYGK